MLNPQVIEIINQTVPWVLLVITLWIAYLTGDVNPRAWLYGGIKQLLWIGYIVYTKDWHLLPTTCGALVLCYINHRKWNPSPGVHAKLVFVQRTTTETELQDPPAPSK